MRRYCQKGRDGSYNLLYTMPLMSSCILWCFLIIFTFTNRSLIKGKNTARTLQSEAVVRTCSIKKLCLKNPQNLLVNACTGVSLLKKKLWHTCFSENFERFLKTTFYRTPPDDYFYLRLHNHLTYSVTQGSHCRIQLFQ